ncbi:MAG: MFS transporter [Chloroflexi bacterium]|nr:MFS transporter [Chloroflexota bacterium]
MNPKPRIFTRDFILVCSAAFAYSAAQSLVVTALPLFLKDLGLAAGFIGGFVGAVSICALVSRLPIGGAVDRFGSRILAAIGAGLLGCSFVLYAFIPFAPLRLIASMPLLLPLAGILHGAGIGTYGTATNSFVAYTVPQARRGEAVGYFGILINVAQAIAAGTSLFIVARWGFTILLGVGMLMAVLAAVFALILHDTPRTTGTQSWSSYFQIEKSSVAPSLVNVTLTLAHGVALTFIALLGLERGIENPGVFFTAIALTSIVARVFTGRTADTFGRLAVVIPGMFLIMASMMLVANVSSMETLALAGIIYGVGIASAVPALQALIIDLAAPERRGAAMATYSGSIDVGIIIGSIAAGQIAPLIGYGGVFLAASVSPLVGLGILLFYARVNRVSLKGTVE